MAVALVATSLLIGIVLRFWTPSAMWLDEALTVNIANHPVREIVVLLRDDGAPPLYYVLLHFWMKVFGNGNLAARSLSGVIGVGTLPVVWLLAFRVTARPWDESSGAVDATERGARARRVAWTATLLMATSPFAVYYDTEARMYALLILVSGLGLLAATFLVERPTVLNAVAIGACTSALLYSHYWALFLVAVAGVGTTWCAWRGPRRTEARVGLAALAVGSLTFVPWLPTFFFQVRHTGTPWATPADFTALVYAFTQLAGGNSDAGRALALAFAFLMLLAIAGSALDARRVELDLRTRPGVRSLAALWACTLVVAVVAGKLSGSTFADRYTAVVTVPAMVVVAYGVTALASRRIRFVVVGVAVGLGLAASIPNAFLSRTQAGQVAYAINATIAPGDVVAYCPDQLGPGVSRLVRSGNQQLTFPRGAPPQIVDWVDYTATIARASVSGFVRLVEHRAGAHAIYYVFAPGYLGFGGDCEAIGAQFAASRSARTLVLEQPPDTPFEIFEGEYLVRYQSR